MATATMAWTAAPPLVSPAAAASAFSQAVLPVPVAATILTVVAASGCFGGRRVRGFAGPLYSATRFPDPWQRKHFGFFFSSSRTWHLDQLTTTAPASASRMATLQDTVMTADPYSRPSRPPFMATLARSSWETPAVVSSSLKSASVEHIQEENGVRRSGRVTLAWPAIACRTFSARVSAPFSESNSRRVLSVLV